MNGILDRLRTWWENSTNTQRYGTLGGIVAGILLMYVIFTVASTPKYSVLFSSLTDQEHANIVSELQAAGIPVRYDKAGTVEVPIDKIPQARMKIATSGKLPKAGHRGIADLDAMNLYTTPAVERERLKSIHEGELAQSIESMPGIVSARVHITLGDPSPFGEQRRAATASVTVNTGGNNISREAARGIAMLVNFGVDGLELRNVVVLNERMEALFNGADADGSGSNAERKIEIEREYSKSEERRIQSALDTIFGSGTTHVTVRAEIDLDEVSKRVAGRTYNKPVDVQSSEEVMPSGMRGVGGAAGTDANNGAPNTRANADDSGLYKNKTTRSEPSYTDAEENVKRATGTVTGMVINVAVNTGKFKDDPAKAAELEAAVNSYVATEFENKNKKKFIAKVTAVAFDDTARMVADTQQKEAASAQQKQQLISLLPIAAIIVIGFMVVKQIAKLTKPQIPSDAAASLPRVAAAPPGIDPGQWAEYLKALEAGVQAQMPMPTLGSAQPTLSELGIPSNLPPVGQLQYALQRGEDGENVGHPSVEHGIEFEDEDEHIRIAKIKERTSIPLEQIKQMSKDRPEAVALLIKSWLSEERR